jgi:hypothetical protein
MLRHSPKLNHCVRLVVPVSRVSKCVWQIFCADIRNKRSEVINYMSCCFVCSYLLPTKFPLCVLGGDLLMQVMYEVCRIIHQTRNLKMSGTN